MDFSDALRLIKNGHRLTRQAWENADRIVAYQPGYPDGIAINANTATATGLPEGTVAVFQPYLMTRDQDGSYVAWTARQADLLAGDWTLAS